MSTAATTPGDASAPAEAPTFLEWLADYRQKERALAEALANFGRIKGCKVNHFYHKPGDRSGFYAIRDGHGVEIKYAPNGVLPT